MSNEHEVRDAVIKLEVKMEQMSDSLSSMAASIEKLADIKYEIRETKMDVETKYQKLLTDHHKLEVQVLSLHNDIRDLTNKQRQLEAFSNKTNWVVDNSSKFAWIVISASIALIVWSIEQNMGK